MPERSSPTASRRITPPPAVAPQEPARPGETTRGLVVAVYGARTGVGVTSVSAALARAFQSLGSEDVVLAELDPRVVRARSQSLNIVGAASARDQSPKASASRGATENGASSADRFLIPGLDAALVRQGDGVWMLAMTRPRTPAVGDAKSVTVALDAMRRRFPVSVAELEHQVNERTLAAFDAADRILLVTEGSVPSLRGTQRVLRLCHRLNYPDEKMCVVLNRFDAPGALPSADVAVALKREIYWKIAVDQGLTIAALAERLLTD